MMYNIYLCNSDDSARYLLGKRGRRKLYIVGLNPSTANRERSDTTVAKVENVAIRNNFDGFVMTNLYPLRSTYPNLLPCNSDQTLLENNIRSIISIAANEESPVFWAAWGENITLRTYFIVSLQNLHSEITRLGGVWVRFGELCRTGHPRHPSRLHYNWNFSPFDIFNYMQRIS